MLRTTATFCLLTGLLASASIMAVSPVHKCEVNGSVTYQNNPCPSGDPVPRPTLEQLTAERKKRAASAASAPATAAARQDGMTKRSTAPAQQAQPEAKASFRCDGRKFCSQMTSCAEAKYFLANCPGVKMDGDGNGVPCERQWCNP